MPKVRKGSVTSELRLSVPPAGTKIWRYLEFSKLISTLERGEFFFPAATSLSDAREGYFTPEYMKKLEKWVKRAKPNEAERIARLEAQRESLSDFQRAVTVVSCWQMVETETYGMWKTYVAGQEGLAISTTVGRLRKALSRDGRFKIFFGGVQYGGEPPGGVGADPLQLFFVKRKPFWFEREFRAVIDLQEFVPQNENDEMDGERAQLLLDLFNYGGIFVKADLQTLFRECYVSPSTPPAVTDVMEQFLRRYEINCPVRLSELAGDQAHHRRQALSKGMKNDESMA
jgi:hypothetical protein